MKKLILTLASVLAINAGANAQIPNGGFENWTTAGAYENPNSWATTNSVSAGPFYSCTKSSDHYPSGIGNYSMRLENKTTLTPATGAGGMVITKGFDFPFKPAFPISGHPSSLTGYYKFNQLNSDTAFIKVNLFLNHELLNPGSLLGDAFLIKTSASAWTSFSLNLPAYTTADSASIWISAYYPETQTNGPSGNSVLYIDNLNFDNLIIGVKELDKTTELFNLYPNPASDKVEFAFYNTYSGSVTARIYTVFGQLVRSKELEPNEHSLNVADMSDGVYLIELQTKEGTQKQKLVIQH
jgi:hypothetical protein